MHALAQPHAQGAPRWGGARLLADLLGRLRACARLGLGVTLALALLAHAAAAQAVLQVAVAANFALPAQKIANGFERETGQRVALALGSTGKFYAQIRHGAPFAVLLAADSDTPARLVREGLAVTESRFTYAVGHLVLWSAQPGLVDAQGEVLGRMARGQLPGKLALADPRLAPYGAAAQQTLAQLGLTEALRPHGVLGENIAQTHQFVKSGNAVLGLVALSQVMDDGRIASGSAWRVPAHLHAPIRQDAVLLTAGASQSPARAFLQYLRSDAARTVIAAHGYTF